MSIKRIFVAISAIFAASTVFADNSSVTSKKYVDDLMSGYQGKLPGSGANTLMIYDDETGIGEKSIAATLGNSASAASVPTVGAVKTGLDGKQDTITGTAGYVMTGTGNAGEVGERAIYGAAFYGNSLVTAENVNDGVINAVNSSLIRVDANGDPSDSGTLWEINTDLFAIGVLPAGYTQLEWIESDGTQYIDTGINPNNSTELEVVFKSLNRTNTEALIGSRDVSTGERKAFIVWENVGSLMRFDYDASSVQVGNLDSVGWNTVVKDGKSNYLNGLALVSNTEGTFSGSYPLYLFGQNTGGFIGNQTSAMVKSVKIWQNGTDLTQYLVPAKNSSNVVGMYDTVTGRFFTSPNGNNFTAGPAVGN